MNKLLIVKKIPIAMRITCLLLCLIVFQLQAEDVYSQKTNISLEMKNTTIEKVLQTIEEKSDYHFLYNTKLVNVDRKVSVRVKDAAIADVLDKLFASEDVEYQVEGNQIILSPKEKVAELVSGVEFAQQQQKTITGKVTDTNGEPIIGATILIKGTSHGTVTDMDGNYTLQNVPEDAILQFSYVGMETQEIPVRGKTVINVTMKEATELLEEVVVVGYGTQKKVNLTGAVASVRGDELTQRPVINVTQSLQGVVPGLIVSVPSRGGTPGKSFSLNIRGQGNLSGSDSPYVLVDGVEMNLADVNPNDIESISVLKDAAAASIYGARAAYGVILITTKKGEKGKMRASYQGNAAWSTPVNLPVMANGYEFAKYFNEGCINAGQTPQYSESQLAILEQYVQNPAGINCWPVIEDNYSMTTLYENNSRGVGSTDWFKFHYKEFAFKQNHNLSLSGGDKTSQYYVSGGYYGEEGLLEHADINYRRFNFNANLSSELTDWLKFKINSKYSLSNHRSPFGDGALNEGMFYHGLARFRPTVSPYDLNGNFSELSQVPYLRSGTYAKTNNSNSVIMGGFELTPLKNWNIFIDYTYKKGTTDYMAFATPATFIAIDGTAYVQNTRTELGIPDKGSFTRSMAATQYQSINFYTNYNFSLGEKHNFSLMAGYQEEDNSYKYLYSKVFDIISKTNPGINLATGDKNISETRNGWATRGFFGRINYDFKGKYLCELNGRYDGSSRFIGKNRWGWFPSISVGWNIAHENFMQSLNHILNTFKIRASYGHLGNQSGAALYTFAQTMNISTKGTWYFPNGRDMIIWGPGTFDPNVTWEKVESSNLGVDYGLFNNRLTGSFDIFRRKTKDMLGPSEDIADMFGANPPNTNNAVMQSKGWEFTVNYRGKIGNKIDYSVGGMIFDAQSKVLEYSNPTFTNPSGNWYKGKKVGEIWGYKVSGIIQTQDEANEYNRVIDTSYLTGIAFSPGDLKFIDLNDDKRINKGANTLGDMGDMTIIGNATPRYQYSLNGSISYKGLTLSVLFQGVGKRDYNPAGSNYFSGASSYAQTTVFKEHLDYWREDNHDAFYTKPYITGAGSINSFIAKTTGNTTDYYLQDASYLRLKNLTVSYDLPKVVTDKIKLSKASVFFSGENLFTITNMIGFFDPELVFVSSDGGKNYPLNKVYSVGLILNL